MALVMCRGGAAKALEAMAGKTAADTPLRIVLFYGATVPASASVYADFSQVSGSGYADASLTAANWTSTPGATTELEYPEVTFEFDDVYANPITGYMVVNASNVLLWAERFASPYTVGANDQIRIIPLITMV